MGTVAALLVAEQLVALRDNATLFGWTVTPVDEVTFILGLPGKDEATYHLRAVCDDFAAKPPAWHWFNPETGAIDNLRDTPKGGAFFHSAGIICAPWNRLAYRAVDARGPHPEWTIGDWQSNPKTGACRTLSAMALRISHELMRNVEGRMAA